MPTTVTSSIGGAGGAALPMDYSTLQSWEDACPANLVTDDKIWKGECYDQGVFVGSGTILEISGQTVDSTRYVWLTCAAGASFKDKADVRTSALLYDETTGQGVAVRTTSGAYAYIVSILSNYTKVEGIQVKNSTKSSNAFNLRTGSVAGVVFNDCLSTYGALGLRGDLTANNCLIYDCNTGASVGTMTLNGCTIANNSIGVSVSSYCTVTIKNTAIFGNITTFVGGTGNSVYSASCNYNATDAASMPGSGNANSLFSLTFADQFESTTTDFRAKSSGSLDLNGTPDTTNIPNDISGTTRHATTPTIGCWEVVANALYSGVVNSNLFRSFIKGLRN